MAFDPTLKEVEPPPRKGFLTTVPGILTAVAGLITAVGGAFGVYWANSGTKDPGPPPTVIAIQAAPVPTDQAQVNSSSVASEVNNSSVNDQAAALIDDCANGSLTACQDLLDMLVLACQGGDLSACDLVYNVSAADSDYEYYGATCGGRLADWEYAGQCSEA
jgi:hypothetical protein